MQQGTWSKEEHDRFLTGVKIHPDGPWRLIARYVGTRSVRQVQTHAQKYHEKIARRMRGLRKERRNHVRTEHRIDGDWFNVLQEPPLANFHYEGPQDTPTIFQYPVDHRPQVAYGKTPMIQLPPLRLAMPSLEMERYDGSDEPVVGYMAKTDSNENATSVVV